MRLRPHQLAWWSFLMSTVHGAGLMLAPVLVGGAAGRPTSWSGRRSAGELLVALAAALLHAAAMVATSAVIASWSTRCSGSRC